MEGIPYTLYQQQSARFAVRLLVRADPAELMQPRLLKAGVTTIVLLAPW